MFLIGIVHTIIFNRDMSESEIKQREISEINFFYPIKVDRIGVDKLIKDVLNPNKLRSVYEVEFYTTRWRGFVRDTKELWRISISKRDPTTWGYDEKKDSLKKQLYNIFKEIVNQKIGNDIDSSTLIIFRVSS